MNTHGEFVLARIEADNRVCARRDIELQLAVDAYWRNRVYNQPQIWLVPTTSDHLHFSQPIGHNTYL